MPFRLAWFALKYDFTSRRERLERDEGKKRYSSLSAMFLPSGDIFKHCFSPSIDMAEVRRHARFECTSFGVWCMPHKSWYPSWLMGKDLRIEYFWVMRCVHDQTLMMLCSVRNSRDSKNCSGFMTNVLFRTCRSKNFRFSTFNVVLISFHFLPAGNDFKCQVFSDQRFLTTRQILWGLLREPGFKTTCFWLSSSN